MRNKIGAGLRKGLRAVIPCLLWLFTCGLALANLMGLRIVLRVLMMTLDVGYWSAPVVERFALLALGIVYVIWILWWEKLYQDKADQSMGHLARFFAMTSVAQVSLMAICLIIGWLASI